jgi:glycine cleavage system transcriptional repressor
MGTLAVTAVGTDQPGIVAAVTAVLMEQGCNLEDTSMSILRGQFAMVLIIAAPDEVDAGGLEWALAQAASDLDLVVSVRAVEHGHATEPDGEAWTVVVYGADHPGIVHGIASVLADLDVNIVDLTTRISEADRPIYAMVMEVTLPSALPPAALELRLSETATALGVDCSLHPSEADIL